MDDFNAGALRGLVNATKIVVKYLEETHPKPTTSDAGHLPVVVEKKPKGAFAFLKLPAELRHKVYEHVIGQSDPSSSSVQPGITTACSQTRAESIQLYFKMTTVGLQFNFPPVCLSLFQFINSSHANSVMRASNPVAPPFIHLDIMAGPPFLARPVLDSKIPGFDLQDGVDYLLGLQNKGKSLPTRIQFPVTWAPDGLSSVTLTAGVGEFDPNAARLVLTVAYNHATGALKLERVEEICTTTVLFPAKVEQHRYSLIQYSGVPRDCPTFFTQTKRPDSARPAVLAQGVHDAFLPLFHMVNEAVPRDVWAGVKNGEAHRLIWMVQLIGAFQSSVFYQQEAIYFTRRFTGREIPFAQW
ncbi:hypothetical protein KVT40_009328 [Elsinoe batatas]|uniref:Uncharacterized protein n=1 Tax=Elsinoe batatas TaxID=2601811 RepID=A0A8K0PBT7_9PEZI|nr:hypothetical protein KVT40_009328 [Elsinoe batatas]